MLKFINDIKCKINIFIFFLLKLNASNNFSCIYCHVSLSIFNVELYYNNSPLTCRGEIPLNSDSVPSPIKDRTKFKTPSNWIITLSLSHIRIITKKTCYNVKYRKNAA